MVGSASVWRIRIAYILALLLRRAINGGDLVFVDGVRMRI
jgi:hypothetical protein